MAEAAHGRVAYHQIITISYYHAILRSQQRTYHVLKAKCVDGGGYVADLVWLGTRSHTGGRLPAE